MDSDLSKAQQYRDRAARMRDIAATEEDAGARGTLLTLAEKYEHMSQKHLGRAQRKQS
jgi:hypothetical protein